MTKQTYKEIKHTEEFTTLVEIMVAAGQLATSPTQKPSGSDLFLGLAAPRFKGVPVDLATKQLLQENIEILGKIKGNEEFVEGLKQIAKQQYQD